MLKLELQNITKTFLVKKKQPLLFQLSNLRSLLSLKSINTFNSNEKTVLEDVNLKLYENEIVGILGKNGVGKSTLIQIIYGLTMPTSGKIIKHGSIQALFGFGSCFNKELTGRENIFLTGTAYGIKKKEIDRIIEDIISFSEIKEIDTPLKFYSKGMKARLGFSIIVHINSEILILDEALTGSDTFFQKKCIARVKEMIALPGKAFIIVSHNEKLIKELCTRAVVLNNGRIVFEAEPKKALEYYKALE